MKHFQIYAMHTRIENNLTITQHHWFSVFWGKNNKSEIIPVTVHVDFYRKVVEKKHWNFRKNNQTLFSLEKPYKTNKNRTKINLLIFVCDNNDWFLTLYDGLKNSTAWFLKKNKRFMVQHCGIGIYGLQFGRPHDLPVSRIVTRYRIYDNYSANYDYSCEILSRWWVKNFNRNLTYDIIFAINYYKRFTFCHFRINTMSKLSKFIVEQTFYNNIVA